MNYKVNATTSRKFEEATQNSDSSILKPADLNEVNDSGKILHYATVKAPAKGTTPPMNDISVKTKNGILNARIFSDKLEQAGLSEGDDFVGSFIVKGVYANADKIMPQG